MNTVAAQPRGSQHATRRPQTAVRDTFDAALERACTATADGADCRRLLDATIPHEHAALVAAACAKKEAVCGRQVFLRALIEISNICAKNCRYCGIRRDNTAVSRYSMTEDDIVEGAVLAYHSHYGSAVLQAGERRDADYVALIERVLKRIADATHNGLRITLSLGEQDRDVYARWRDAGAHRYLLRIETSNPALYRRLHPADHSLAARLRCLDALRDLDYQVGTGVLIGVPGQTTTDLANDILFFREHDIDMIGMGPYIPHPAAPLAGAEAYVREAALALALRMIAVTRLLLPDVNIAAATALEALCDDGRERGLLAGANVVMDNLTRDDWRRNYSLYPGKPGIDRAATPPDVFAERMRAIGEVVAVGEWGDARHYCRRTEGRAS